MWAAPRIDLGFVGLVRQLVFDVVLFEDPVFDALEVAGDSA